MFLQNYITNHKKYSSPKCTVPFKYFWLSPLEWRQYFLSDYEKITLDIQDWGYILLEKQTI